MAGYRTLLAVMAVVTFGAAAYLLSRREQRAANHPGHHQPEPAKAVDPAPR